MKLAKHQENGKRSLAPVSRTFSPFLPVQRLQHQIDRWVGYPISEWLTSNEPFFEDWMPAVNVYEEKNSIVVKAELPGMKKDDFEVYMTGDGLNIAGERKEESERKTANGHRSERRFGHFHRIISLPASIKADSISGQYKDGILTITCPKGEDARREQVKVS